MITSGTIAAGAITTDSITFYPVQGEPMEGEDMHPGSFTLEDRHGDAFITVTPHDRPGKVTIKTSPDGITITRPMLEMLTAALNKGRDYKARVVGD